jgi:hypothetical protein
MTEPSEGRAVPFNEFALRPPSQAWEQLTVSGPTPRKIWAWFKPAHIPNGIILRIPDDLWSQVVGGPPLTLRAMVLAAGVDPAFVLAWQQYGQQILGLNGANPLFDQPLAAPVAGVDPSIVVFVGVAAVPLPLVQSPPVATAMPSGTSPAAPTSQTELFEHIDMIWNSVLEIEKDQERLRKMLVDMSSRLKGLNRDLGPDERLYSSREDKQDWQEARRWLRDCENKLRACIKEYDIGDQSSAGQRRWFEAIHSQFIVPRIPFEGMEQAATNFDYYLKMVTTLQGKMNNAYLAAQNNGERRAMMVLARIANKVREATNKKTALGVILDG